MSAPLRCPTCGVDGPARGRSFCEVCGDDVDWDAIGSALTVPGTVRAPDTAQRRRAKALLVPVADDPPPVPPGRPEPRRPTVRPPQAAAENGIICWNCGTDNTVQRWFCRNCGVSLRAATALPAPGWPSRWERFLGWLARNRVLLVAVVVGALLGVAFWVAWPRLFGDETVFVPHRVAASRENVAHPDWNAFDGRTATWWGTGRGPAAGVNVIADFAAPVDLRAIVLTPGRHDHARPETVELTIIDVLGRATPMSVRLADGEPQRIPLTNDDVTSVRLTLRTAYGATPEGQVALAEVRFLGVVTRS